MSINKPHEFSLEAFALKGESIEKVENAVFKMFDKLHSDGIIINDPREPYDKNKIIEPNKVIMFHLYETKDEI